MENLTKCLITSLALKPRLHERFLACDGDAIFWKIVASPARGENRMCSHPRTGDATDEKTAEKNREKFNELNFCDKITVFVRGWLHLRFSPRAGDGTISKKMASPSQAKNRSCSRGFRNSLLPCYSVMSPRDLTHYFLTSPRGSRIQA